MIRVGVGEGDEEGGAGEALGEGEADGDPGPLPGAGPMGCAPLSAHAVVSTATAAVMTIRRFMGCLLLPGTGPMLDLA